MTKEAYINSAILTAKNAEILKDCNKETAFKLGLDFGWTNGKSFGITTPFQAYEAKLAKKDKKIAELQSEINNLKGQLNYLKSATDKRLPSTKQLDFIDVICKVLEIPKPRCLNMTEARNWISEHIDAYYKQLEYIKEFECYDWSMPNGD